jgi:predicted dehydrogenase
MKSCLQNFNLMCFCSHQPFWKFQMTHQQSSIDRRTFLQQSSASIAAGGFAASVWGSTQAIAGPVPESERIRIGAIGVGNRGKLLLKQLPESAELVAISDCNLSRAEAFKAEVGGNWPAYHDYRKILERKDIDAVIVATGEFQRVLPCIEACQAGKDVYAEKPLTLYIQEGRALVQAVRKYDRVLQVGTQQRSMEINRVACELLRNGGLGKILEVRAIAYTGPAATPQEPFPAQEGPVGLNWNQWLNQASMRPFHSDWMGWMRWRDFSGGEMTNWGAHGVDQIQWALGMDDTGPIQITPLTSGPHGHVRMEYANGVQVNFIIQPGEGPMGGAIFICEKGKLEVNRNKVTSNPPEIAVQLKAALDIEEEERKWSDNVALWQARWHLQNWCDCIRSRRRPVADVEIGHRSISVCHLANIVRSAGRPLVWDPEREVFANDNLANQFLARERRKGFELPNI